VGKKSVVNKKNRNSNKKNLLLGVVLLFVPFLFYWYYPGCYERLLRGPLENLHLEPMTITFIVEPLILGLMAAGAILIALWLQSMVINRYAKIAIFLFSSAIIGTAAFYILFEISWEKCFFS